MIANIATTAYDQNRFNVECERIRRDCPAFVEWLKRSAGETLRSIHVMSDDGLQKEIGAHRDITLILDTIATPPSAELFRTGETEGA